MQWSNGMPSWRGCIPQNKPQTGHYRWEKQKMDRFQPVTLAVYPSPRSSLKGESASRTDDHLSHMERTRNRPLDRSKEFSSDDYLTRVYEKRDLQLNSIYEIVRDALPKGTITFKKHYLPFICNRGLAVQYYTGHTVCFCVPNAFGSQCEFYSDRILVQTHLNLTNYRPKSDQIAIIKVLITFLFENQVVDYDLFHVNPWIELDKKDLKNYFYFMYPRTEKYLQMKRTNRSGTQLYNVRFEAFDLYSNGKIQPIGVWRYPIYFDFLPSFRLSKILHFRPPIYSSSQSLCLGNRCGPNGICQDILNSNGLFYYCLCHSGYYGTHCESYDEQCNNYCSPKSICKAEYQQMITGDQRPLCLCPVSTFGRTCFLENNECQFNPCLHGGTCIVAYDITDTNAYLCICTDAFEGNHCPLVQTLWHSLSKGQPSSKLHCHVIHR